MNNLSRFASAMTLGASMVDLVLMLTGCAMLSRAPTPMPLPMVHTQNLILDAQAFPKGWIVDPCAPESACERQYRERESHRTFGRIGIPGHVVQQVFRFDTVEAAQAKFQRVREVDFRPRLKPNSQLVPPPEITYRSPIADEYQFGCGVDRGPVCEALFRYGNYYVEFFFHVDRGYVGGAEIRGEGLKIEQVEPILRAMDEHAATVLGLHHRSTPVRMR